MLVHLIGNPCDMQKIKKIAKKHDLWLIEDACEAHGAKFYKKHVGSFGDLSTSSRAFFTDDFGYDPQAVKKFWKDSSLGALLGELGEKLSGVESLDATGAEQCLRALAENKGLKAGLLINSSRVALTGQAVAPSLFEVMEVLGQDRVVSRLMRAAELLPARAPASDE